MKVYCFRGRALAGAAVVSVMCAGLATAQQTTQGEVRQQPAQPGQTQPVVPGQARQVQPGQARQVQVGQARQVQPGQAGQNQASESQGDRQIVKCLILDNKKEVELARIADRQAKSDDVKAFAQEMIEGHTKFIKKLEELKGDKQQTAGQAADKAATAHAGQGKHTDFVAIHREIGEKVFTAVKAELESKEGSKFDKCYMTQQVMCHTKMVATLEVLQNHVSGELRDVLGEGLEMAEHHLDQAEDIVKNLKDDK